MKILTGIVLTILSFTIVSSRGLKSNLPNVNSWCIKLNEKELLASWLGNEMGDTVTLVKSQLKDSDTLFIQRYLCGQSAENSLTDLTITNSNGEKIAQTVSENKHLMFTSHLEMRELIHSPQIKSGSVVGVYFSIIDESDNTAYTSLLGYLKLE